MRILIVNQFYDPDPAATAQVAAHLARRLVAKGHDVTAIASRYSHIKKGLRLPKRETIDGVRVLRVGGTDFGRGSIVGRIVDTATFYALLAWRVMVTTRVDACLLMTSPPMVETLGPVVKLLRGRRCWVACWLMDLNPDIAIEMGVMPARSPLMRLCAVLGRRAMRGMDHLVAIGPCMAARVKRRGVDPARVSVVETGSDPAALAPLDHTVNAWRREQGLALDRPLLMYSGNMGIGHPLTDFIAMYEALAPAGGDPGFELLMIGSGSRRKEPESFIARAAPRHFRLLPYQPFERLNESLAAADVHLVSMAGNMTGAFIPSKVYGIMSVGRPFIYVGPRDSTVGLVAQEGPCGIVVEPGDIEGLVEAAHSLLRDPGLRARLGAAGRRLVETKYARALCEDRLIEIIEARAGALTGGQGEARTRAGEAA